MSFKPEVLVGGDWSGSALRFATLEESEGYGFDLLRRWTVPAAARTVRSDDPVNYKRFSDGRIEAVKS